MNLKHFFYRQYFDGVDLRKYPEKEKKDDEIFTSKNKDLTSKVPSQNLLDSLRLDDYFSKKNFFTVDLVTQYPGLFTGSGYHHEIGSVGELKLGFFFDHTTGLPIIPGSSVKGTLRNCFPSFGSSPMLTREMMEEDKMARADYIKYLLSDIGISFPDDSWITFIHLLELQIFEGLDIQISRLAGKPSYSYLSVSKRDCFFDAVPIKIGSKGKLLGEDAITPHGDDPLKNPIPLHFLKILPGVTFHFQWLLFSTHIDNFQFSGLKKKELFEKILLNGGIGAKTNVGYGQFIIPPMSLENKANEGKLIPKSETTVAKHEVGGIIIAKITKTIAQDRAIEVEIEGETKSLRQIPINKFKNLYPLDKVTLEVREISPKGDILRLKFVKKN